MRDITFQPRLAKPKPATPKVVIRRGQEVAKSPNRRETQKQQKDTSSRLMRYGAARQAKRADLKKIKDSVEGTMYDFKPQTCNKSNKIVQEKQQQLLTQYLQN